MKNILVVYYTQTGQLKKVLDSFLSPLESAEDVSISYYNIKPKKEFSFPWSARSFMGAFPETFRQIPIELDLEDTTILNQKYDLIILGWQPWFLSPSLPISSFLKTDFAEKLFNNVPVLTITACRNMWINGFEKLKLLLSNLDVKLTGNIVLTDPNPNLISLFTIVGWLLYGKKENFLGMLPASGITEEQIKSVSRFGLILKDSLRKGSFADLNNRLLEADSVIIDPPLMYLEMRGARIFSIWAKLIGLKGSKSNLRRKIGLGIFTIYLPIVIIIVSPIEGMFTKIQMFFSKRKTQSLVLKFQGR